MATQLLTRSSRTFNWTLVMATFFFSVYFLLGMKDLYSSALAFSYRVEEYNWLMEFARNLKIFCQFKLIINSIVATLIATSFYFYKDRSHFIRWMPIAAICIMAYIAGFHSYGVSKIKEARRQEFQAKMTMHLQALKTRLIIEKQL